MIKDLGSLNEMVCDAPAINGGGDVVGWMDRPSRNDVMAFLWRRGRLIDLRWQPGGIPRALGINDRGEIVGHVERSPGPNHAVLWRDGDLLDLNNCVEPRPAFTFTVAEGINNRGEILAVGERPGDEGRERYFLLIPVMGRRAVAPRSSGKA
jgi:probable HAF family extracellular repeat protein